MNSKKHPLRLARIAESVYEKGFWYVNDESAAERLTHKSAAFFHFHHWDELITNKHYSDWDIGDEPLNNSSTKNNQRQEKFNLRHEKGSQTEPSPYAMQPDCMVLYLRNDGALSYESCDIVSYKEVIINAS